MSEKRSVRVAAAAIFRDGDGGRELFATQRGYGPWKDYWEFPGGKIEAGEEPEAALAREIREELAAEVRVGAKLRTVDYDYPDFHLSMELFSCGLAGEGPTLLEHEAARWLKAEELDEVLWLPADQEILPLIRACLTEGREPVPEAPLPFTEERQLAPFGSACRLWQGIPGVAVTKKGRLFVCFYSGGVREEIGNFSVLLAADESGRFGEPVAAAFREGKRCYDPAVWVDPAGRLWFFWAQSPENGVWASVCEDPDAEKPVFSPARRIAEDVMLNKPTVTEDGRWLLPAAVWARDVFPTGYEYKEEKEDGAFVWESTDGGESFRRLGKAVVPDRSFDEHMLVERRDGTLRMYVRTHYGIGMADSADGGLSFEDRGDSGLGGPNSRFFIARLRSGRLLLVNHVGFEKRDHLTALLSEDDGETWPYRLLLDERAQVSYPDAAEGEDGTLYIVYDHERGYYKNSLADMKASAREILLARIREEDILAGRIVSEGSRLREAVSRLS